MERGAAKEDPRLVLPEHPCDDGTVLVCALNTRDTPAACPLTVQGEVGRIWNGTFRDGILSIRENDGCVFEVTPK